MKYLSLCASLFVFHSHADEGQLFHKYIWANYKQFNQEPDQAQKYYQKIIANAPSHFAYKGYIHHLQETNQWGSLAKLIPAYDSIFANDTAVQMIFAQALEIIGNQNASDERLVKLNGLNKTNQEITFSTAQMYMRRKEPENALKVLDAYLENTPDKSNNFIFYFVKSQIYVQMNNKNEALKSVSKSLQLYPKFDKSWLLLALLEEQAGRMEQAVTGYMNFLQETNEPKAQVAQHVSQLILQHNLSNSLLHHKNDTALHDAQRALEAKEYTRALSAIEKCLAQEPHNNEYKIFKIDILAQMKEFETAVKLALSWLHEEPTNELWYETVHLLQRKNRQLTNLTINALQTIEKKDPKNILPLLYLADLYIRANNSAAKNYLTKTSQLATEAKVKKAVLYQLSLQLYDRRDFNELKKTLLALYELDPEFLPALNMLAYYYASKENNLPHAFMLIEKVTTKEPSNIHYLDTKAFILYKQGNYQQAKELLEKVITQAPHDLTIVRHLAKANYQLGQKQEAQTLLATTLQTNNFKTSEHKKLIALQQRWHDERTK